MGATRWTGGFYGPITAPGCLLDLVLEGSSLKTRPCHLLGTKPSLGLESPASPSPPPGPCQPSLESGCTQHCPAPAPASPAPRRVLRVRRDLLTRPSLWSASVQASMNVCAMTKSTASMLSDVCTSNTNCGFFMMLIQNLRGRLRVGQAWPVSTRGKQERRPRHAWPTQLQPLPPLPTCWSSRCGQCPGRRCHAAGPARPAGQRST